MSNHLLNEPRFDQVVRDHQQMVFRTLVRLTGHNDNIDDLAQDVFLRLFRSLPSFRGEALVSTYLYRITVNVAQDEWKRRQKQDRKHVSLSEERGHGDGSSWTYEDRLEHPGAHALEQMEQDEFRQSVEEQLMQLSQVERAVIRYYHQTAIHHRTPQYNPVFSGCPQKCGRLTFAALFGVPGVRLGGQVSAE